MKIINGALLFPGHDHTREAVIAAARTWLTTHQARSPWDAATILHTATIAATWHCDQFGFVQQDHELAEPVVAVSSAALQHTTPTSPHDQEASDEPGI